MQTCQLECKVPNKYFNQFIFTSYQFYCYFYIKTESIITSPLTSSTDLTTSSLSSLSDLIILATPTDTPGKTKSEAHTIYICCSCYKIYNICSI